MRWQLKFQPAKCQASSENVANGQKKQKKILHYTSFVSLKVLFIYHVQSYFIYLDSK